MCIEEASTNLKCKNKDSEYKKNLEQEYFNLKKKIDGILSINLNYLSIHIRYMIKEYLEKQGFKCIIKNKSLSFFLADFKLFLDIPPLKNYGNKFFIFSIEVVNTMKNKNFIYNMEIPHTDFSCSPPDIDIFDFLTVDALCKKISKLQIALEDLKEDKERAYQVKLISPDLLVNKLNLIPAIFSDLDLLVNTPNLIPILDTIFSDFLKNNT